MSAKRDWLSFVKQGRTVHNDSRCLHDKFEEDRALKKYLQLVEYMEEEMAEIKNILEIE